VSHDEIMIARTRLGANFDAGPDSFERWFGNSVSYNNTSSGSFGYSRIFPPGTCQHADAACHGLDNSGIAGIGSPIFPMDQNNPSPASPSYKSCQADGLQHQSSGSISYVESQSVYLMLFVCRSPRDPSGIGTGGPGAAWFFSTLDATKYDLSRQDQWTTPQEIEDSWAPLESNNQPGSPSNCVYDGWYPSLMSPGLQSGHLSTEGYVFSMKGCLDTTSGTSRGFSSRTFKIE
jgi:hypothetical protein